MNILCWGLVSISLSLIVQLVVWKVYLPKRQTRVLLCIFIFIMFITLAVARGISEHLNVLALKAFLEYLHVCLFVISLMLAYMITYSAIEVDSPSLVMINAIAKAGPEGLDERLFNQLMNDDLLVKPRLADLLNDKMAYIDCDKYYLTSKGILFARLFIFYRKLLNAPKGG